MTTVRRLGDLLHRLTHRVPGVPPHIEQRKGHQRPTRPGPRLPAAHLSANHRWNHAPIRPPRVLAGWQRRIAARLGQSQ